jgi:hypothetical protein
VQNKERKKERKKEIYLEFIRDQLFAAESRSAEKRNVVSWKRKKN